MTQNDKIAKFSKIDFLITTQDMNIEVVPDKNKSLEHVLKHLRQIYHPNSQQPPAIFRTREIDSFLPLFFAQLTEALSNLTENAAPLTSLNASQTSLLEVENYGVSAFKRTIYHPYRVSSSEFTIP